MRTITLRTKTAVMTLAGLAILTIGATAPGHSARPAKADDRGPGAVATTVLADDRGPGIIATAAPADDRGPGNSAA
ncbi:hypothetical protein ACWDFR_07075 [Streptomyces sp. 900105755]|uniref:hypothetical protein n=1 Tax=Streptomyces sp. NPDC001507 TaxID=3364579 RepID=UPI0036751F68